MAVSKACACEYRIDLLPVHILLDALQASEEPKKMIIAFIWLDNKLHTTEEIEYKVKKLLYHIAEEKL